MVSHAGVGWGFKKHKRQRRKVKEWERERDEPKGRRKRRGGCLALQERGGGEPFFDGTKDFFSVDTL